MNLLWKIRIGLSLYIIFATSILYTSKYAENYTCTTDVLFQLGNLSRSTFIGQLNKHDLPFKSTLLSEPMVNCYDNK